MNPMGGRGPGRVLHVNLAARGIGRYGVLFAQALHRRDGVGLTAIANEEVLDSPVFGAAAREVSPHTVRGLPLRWGGLRAAWSATRHLTVDAIVDSAGPAVPVGTLLWPLLRRRAPLLVVVHDPVPHSGMGRSAASRMARVMLRLGPHRLLVHGSECRRSLLRMGFAEDRIATVRHGHLAIFDQGAAGAAPREPDSVLFFGELRPNKGVELLVPLAERVVSRHPRAKFIVAGSDRMGPELRRSEWPGRLAAILAEMSRRPYFEVHRKFIPDEQVGGFFRRAGVALLPYLDASQSGVLMVAMPLGATVVCTDVGDMPEIVDHGRTGYLARPDLDSLAERLDRVLSQPEQARAVAERARAHALDVCDWGKVVSAALAAAPSRDRRDRDA